MKRISLFQLVLLVSCFYSSLSFAVQKSVAKVILMKGEAKGKTIDGEVFKVKIDQDIAEGSVLQTAEKSFVKLIFIDKSQMNLGPKSQMVINTFPQNDPGIITLIKGQLRSKVTKDYMGIDDKNSSKLYIKTASAAMGIRGTDFQVNYNEVNHNTSLITFEGAVAMANVNHKVADPYIDQRQLEGVVSSDKAVMVKEGQISVVNLNISEMAMVPTKLGSGQMAALKGNETGTKETTGAVNDSNNKQYRSPIPPGVDGALFSSSHIGGEYGLNAANANGFFNQSTGQYKLPAGSIIDLNSVNIVPPPTNAVYDPNAKMYVVPTNYGKIDPSTGEYKAPEGLKLGNDGKFQVVPGKERGPASEGVSAVKKVEAPNLFEARPDMAQFADKYGSPINPPPPPPGVMNDQMRNIVNDRMNTTDTLRNNATNTGVNLPTSRVRFIFNVK
jgi:hypothetical protein